MVRVAVTQQEPVYFDLAGAVDKTCNLIAEASTGGAQLIAFPEVWICGYPMWICIAVVLGFSERDGDTLYISQCTISASGDILNKRRKLKPSHMEKTVYGDGDEKSLFSVVDIQGVGKTGALSCFEHTQPLLKFHNIAQGEKIHIAAWPPLKPYENTMEEVFSMTAEGTVAVLGGGNSAVFAPDGRRLTQPIKSDEEGIVYADLPMEMGTVSKQIVDVIGHGAKPSVLWLGVDGDQKDSMRVLRSEESGKRKA
ncbi:hypothetical protein N0V90_005814 [Kalmusia sp. IMI 367209]|nr:hypothetical protein N0V90_005814 [Kalmusia sp. IMI 367209]